MLWSKCDNAKIEQHNFTCFGEVFEIPYAEVLKPRDPELRGWLSWWDLSSSFTHRDFIYGEGVKDEAYVE